MFELRVANACRHWGLWVRAITWAALLTLPAVFLLAGCGERSPTAAASTSAVDADSASHYLTGAAVGLDGRGSLVALPPAPKPTGPLPSGASCITAECHSRFHTSRRTHAPAAAGECLTCHLPDAGGHHYPLARSPRETCSFCHSVTGTQKFEHAALTQGTCTTCHDPHASTGDHLIKAGHTEQLCTQCHDVAWKRFAHGPFAAGQCTLCHNPHQSDVKGLLRHGSGPDHCQSCHTDLKATLAKAVVVHAPARQACENCHDPHTSDQPNQLRQPAEQLCLSCHQPLAAKIASATVTHAAVSDKRACGNCHAAHAAGQKNLLRDRSDHLCLTCHDKPVKAADGHLVANMSQTLQRPYLHGPVRSGDCAACHEVHGSTHARLLTQAFPAQFYAPFNLTNYALCFNCHSKELVLLPKTDKLTGFRDGESNLHYIHVHRDDKGRTCRTCHDVHGSDLPNHIAQSVPFEGSGWSMPIGYVKRDDGGSCSPGCHEPKTYRRDPNTSATQPAAPLAPSASAPAVSLRGVP